MRMSEEEYAHLMQRLGQIPAAPKAQARVPTEARFLADILRFATPRGWIFYHTHDSRRSPEGFPDLVLARQGEVVFAELKRDARSKLTQAQATWLSVLRTATVVDAYEWRPNDWAFLTERLT